MPRSTPGLARAGALACALVLVQALLIAWFSWPTTRLAPRDLPVVVAGPAPAAATLAQRLSTERPGAFAVTTVADEAAADAALRDRDAYAAFLVGPDGVRLHVASAASPTVAALLTQAVQLLGGGRPVPVVDVVPTGPDDPRGAGLATGFLPLLLISLAGGVAMAAAVRSRAARLTGILTFAALSGVVAAAVMDAMGVLTGGLLAEAGATALLALAVAGAVAGLTAALGRAGTALGVLLVFLLGNPISGAAAAPELLPEPWGQLGQLLPPGAGVSLLRSAAFFDGAAATGPLWVLAAWSLAGLALLAVGRASLVHVRAEPAPVGA